MWLNANSIIRITCPSLDAHADATDVSEVLCRLCQDVVVRCIDVRVIGTSTWARCQSGWLFVRTSELDEPSVQVIHNESFAEKYWQEEKEKQKKMAAAIASCLVRSHSLPRAQRLARSLLKHSLMIDTTRFKVKQFSGTSMEDIMISLAGKSGLDQKELFGFIRAAAATHSCPGESVRIITQNLFEMLGTRPSKWVTEGLNVVVTEDIRIDNNRFVMSAAEGNVKLFRSLLDNGTELTSLHSDLRYTALHAAADFGQLEILNIIIRTGFSVNVRDPVRGQTALHYAAYSGRPEIVQLLIAAGADRMLRCSRGVLPYEAAAKQGHEECSELLKFLPPTALDLRVSDDVIVSCNDLMHWC